MIGIVGIKTTSIVRGTMGQVKDVGIDTIADPLEESGDDTAITLLAGIDLSPDTDIATNPARRSAADPGPETNGQGLVNEMGKIIFVTRSPKADRRVTLNTK